MLPVVVEPPAVATAANRNDSVGAAAGPEHAWALCARRTAPPESRPRKRWICLTETTDDAVGPKCGDRPPPYHPGTILFGALHVTYSESARFRGTVTLFIQDAGLILTGEYETVRSNRKSLRKYHAGRPQRCVWRPALSMTVCRVVRLKYPLCASR